MSDCRCAKCIRSELYNATGMSLSLAWNKILNNTCYLEKLPGAIDRCRSGYVASGNVNLVKEAS